MRLFLTGDTHNNLEINRLSRKRFPLGRKLTKNDLLIVLGDYGIPWDGQKSDEYWLNWCEALPFSLAFIDGNHINFNLLYQYPVEEWNGGKTHILRPHIHHLMRGELFTFNNQTFFTFGGARSTDRYRRKENVSWWPQEIASREEMQHGADTLTANDFKVDSILTHCAPNYIVNKLYNFALEYDDMTNYLEKCVRQDTQFKKWFCGHYHENRYFENDKYNVIYTNIVELMPDGKIVVVNN